MLPAARPVPSTVRRSRPGRQGPLVPSLGAHWRYLPGRSGAQAGWREHLRGGSNMTTRVGINGFGRIGRSFTRLALERTDLEVVAVNDITDSGTLAHLLAFDSTYGRLGRTVEHTPDSMSIDGVPIAVLSERDPAAIDWGRLGADIVIESTGKFRTRDGAALHLKGGARKVLISAPGKGVDLTVVLGRQRRRLRPAAARRDLQRVLHHQLRGPDGQGAERRVRHRARLHDHDPRLHRRPDAARRSAQGPAPRPVGGGQHRAHHDRRGPGHRAGHPRGGREAGRDVPPGAGGGRVADRPRGRARPGGHRRRGQRGVRRRGVRARWRAS